MIYYRPGSLTKLSDKRLRGDLSQSSLLTIFCELEIKKFLGILMKIERSLW